MLGLENAIEGCLKNRNKSKEMIYKSFYGYLMGVVLRYVNDRNDAEELVNDTFIKIFKSMAQFSFPKDEGELQRAFKGWIARISSRTAIDFLRTKKNAFVCGRNCGRTATDYTYKCHLSAQCTGHLKTVKHTARYTPGNI